MTQAKRSNPPRKKPVQPEAIAQAIEQERAIAEEAAEIRGEATELDADLFMRLYPLLLRPIPEGFIETVSAGDGKPYDSTGVRSVQVQHGRMNAVLTPMWWREEVKYEHGGQLCHVTVYVGEHDLLFKREAYGGVREANTKGNTYKGSYTNAAKLAFARVGPGHEVYVGAADLDPDVNEQARKAAGKGGSLPDVETINAETYGRMRDRFDAAIADLDEDGKKALLDMFKVKLGSMGVAGVSSLNTALARLTPAQADEVEAWLAGGINGS